jgi:hypothetical protein
MLKPEGALALEDVAPLDEAPAVLVVLAVPEGPPAWDVEAPAESLALAPTLVSVTLYVLPEVLSVGAIWAPPEAAEPATAQMVESARQVVQRINS